MTVNHLLMTLPNTTMDITIRLNGIGQKQHCQLRERAMKSDELRRRLNKNRTMVPVSIRMPEDVIEDLKKVAPQLGFSGYQPLIRAYIGQGLRQDLMRLETTLGLNYSWKVCKTMA